MLKANKKTLIITSIVTVLPILIGAILWDRLPDVMATHFGVDNEANGFSGKAFAVFGLPLFLLAVHWLGALIIACDPKKQNIGQKLFTLVLWIVPVVSLVVAAIEYPVNLGYQMDVGFYTVLPMGILFIVIGNYLPKARQNYTVGIKIPWTLANEENWNRTHRLAGYLWISGGIIMIIAGMARIISGIWLLPISLAMVLAPCIYSYWLHARRGL